MRIVRLHAENRWAALAAASAIPVLLALLAAAAHGAERVAVPGSDVQIHNICGTVTVEAGSGADVIVEVTRGGRDAAKLKLEQGSVGAARALRVLYPSDEIVYPPLGRHSRSQFTVCRDGRLRSSEKDCFFGRSVVLRGEGRGFEAHADLRVLIPAGRKVAVYLAAGGATATNVKGDLRLDMGSASATVHGHRGALSLDVGSGDVDVVDVDGDLDLDTGSGDVHVQDVKSDYMNIDTGSGEVTGDLLTANRLSVDTGSGGVELSGVQAPDATFDTGSGDVEIGFAKPFTRLHVDTGSGSVVLHLPSSQGAVVDFESGSGDLDSDLPLTMLNRDEDHTRARFGDGRGRLHVETGSGDLRLVSGTGSSTAR